MLEEDGYPSLEALKAAVSDRTAALMINNPDDMGIYNPHIEEWVRIVKAAGGLAFYDHANFNGVMGRIRARELGFDACMFMLHKTFGAPKGGGGPAVGAYGCTAELAPFLPAPVVVRDGDRYRLDHDRPQSVGQVREFCGNLPAGAQGLCLGAGHGRRRHPGGRGPLRARQQLHGREAGRDPGRRTLQPRHREPRLEMTRWSLGPLKEATGIGTVDVANRMADFGIDPWWMSHEPWVVPEPFTPEAGEMWSKEDIDEWIAVVAKISTRPTPTRSWSGPRRTPSRSARSTPAPLDDPARGR